MEEQIRAWRFSELTEAGYSHDLAQVIASCFDVDLHQACDLVKAGCRPSVAAFILL